MKFRAIAIVVAVFVMALGAVAAQAGPSQMVGITAGLTMPMGDAADAFGTGFHFGGSYCYKLNPQIGLGGDLNYHMLGEKSFDGDLLGTPVTIKSKLSALQAGGHVKVFMPMKDSKMEPYLKAGLGIYNMSVKATVDIAGLGSGSGTTSESKFGFNGGVGVMMAANDKASYGLEALYHIISTEGSSTNLITVGATYNFNIGK